MKKKLLLILFIFGGLCGCTNNNIEDKYSNFVHYSSSDFEKTFYNHGYVVATLSEWEAASHLLLYQISQDDYILLDKIDSCRDVISIDSSNTYFYKDKLYLLRCGSGAVIEYLLEEEKTKPGKLVNYDTSKISKEKIFISSIEKIENNYIYYTGSTGKSFTFKCSLDTNICELDN